MSVRALFSSCCFFLVAMADALYLPRARGEPNGFGSPGGSGCASRRAFAFGVVTATFTIPPANGDELVRYKSKAGDHRLDQSHNVSKAPSSEKTSNADQTNELSELSFGDIVLPSSEESEEKSAQAGVLEQALQEKKSRRTIDPRTHG